MHSASVPDIASRRCWYIETILEVLRTPASIDAAGQALRCPVCSIGKPNWNGIARPLLICRTQITISLIQWRHNGVARVVYCNGAILEIRQQLNLYRFANSPSVKCNPICNIDAIFNVASLTDSTTASFIDNAWSTGTRNNLKFNPSPPCNANICIDSLYASKLTWFAYPHFCSSCWRRCVS